MSNWAHVHKPHQARGQTEAYLSQNITACFCCLTNTAAQLLLLLITQPAKHAVLHAELD